MNALRHQFEAAAEYERMQSNTLKIWDRYPDTGDFIGPPKGYDKLGVSIGSIAKLPDGVLEFMSRILELKDANILAVPASTNHFTFLALSSHQYQSLSEVPPELEEVKKLLPPFVNNLNWQITDLRLIPGPNYLILAGLPNEEAFQRRLALAQALQKSIWKNMISSRFEYAGIPFPPKIWHTTLFRYQHEQMPQNIRNLIIHNLNKGFGSLTIPSPTLRLIDYVWTFSRDL